MKRYLLALAIICGFANIDAQTIYEIQGQQDDSPYDGQTVDTGGIVTAVASDGFFIQDGDGSWNGIYVYDQNQNPNVGDEVSLSAVVDEYYTLTELTNVSDFEVLSSGNALPTPLLITTAQANEEEYEGVLVRVESATCTNPDLGFNEFEINDGSGSTRVDDMIFLFVAEQDVSYHVTGIAHYSFDFYKILPTGPADIQLASPLYFVETPEEFNLANASMDIMWETNVPANTILNYGLTTNYELGTIQMDDLTTDHTVLLTGLSPATVYFLQAYSEEGENTTTIEERVVCTSSESSGDIVVYFTQPVNTDAATLSDAIYTADITQEFVNYIGLAESTLDITMYDTEGCDEAIIAAINMAYDTGVSVRYITDDELENEELDDLATGIQVLAGNAEGIMHDKFIVIDADDAENAWVVTGSTNHTTGNLGWDFNNVVCIQDQSLAKAYTLEFEEMWGSDDPIYNIDNAAFAGDKTDNTPHKFNLNGIEAELYFSPSDGTEFEIGDQLLDAQNEIAFAIMAFTSNPLGNVIVAQSEAGVAIQGIIDYVEFNGSEFDYLVNSGIDVIDYQNEDGSQWPYGPVLHHKYAITDYEPGSASPAVITGSHNWTASANSINDENTLIIHDHEVANWFFQEFAARMDLIIDNLPEVTEIGIDVFPNPSSNALTITSEAQQWVKIFDNRGALVHTQLVTSGNNSIQVDHLSPGTYIVNLGGVQGAFAKWMKL